ncbi:MAG TPA: ComF family protein, partial [Myxococcota bacterium]|nr:ComF family protein [Myxococcota bacterium]
MSSLLGAIQDLLFPPACLGCTRRLDSSRPPLFCDECLKTLAFITSPLCPCCGVPFAVGEDHLCGECLQSHYAFDRARSLFLYQPPVADIILQLKFGGRLGSLATLGSLAAGAACLQELTEPDLIVPVPLHLHRLRSRGFNQATHIARACFPHWTKKIEVDALHRTRQTTPQSQLSGRERRTNLHQVFAIRKRVEVRDKRILVVDDVLTTGST